MRLRLESKQRGGFLIDRHLNKKKIFPVCLILHIRESGFAHILALLFINGVFTGAAAGVMTSICVFFYVETHEISPRTLIACRVVKYPAPYCVSCVAKRIFFDSKKTKKPCIVNTLLYNFGFMDFIVDLLHAVGSSCTAC